MKMLKSKKEKNDRKPQATKVLNKEKKVEIAKFVKYKNY